LLAGMAYARALLAPDEAAEERFQQALDRSSANLPFARARLQLAFGSWLRRNRRVAESRAHLGAARDGFAGIGAEPWVERAAEELRAAGVNARRHGAHERDELTDQELQIARMAATGLSNREIGARLFVSHRTVSSHLYRVFPKLGITSRAQLRDALEGDRGDTSATVR
jgi:DNA-binding CsgD family transcriptional regulator